jgi:uncharacterized membrane protein YqjE
MARPPPVEEPNLIDALQRVMSSVIATLEHRLELASIEIGEAGTRLVLALVASLAALALFIGAVACLTAWLAVALWPMLGSAVLGWIALGYALIGGGLLLWLRTRLLAFPPLLGDTLAELHTDAVLLHQRGDRPS